MRSWAEPKGGLKDLTVLWQVISVLDFFFLSPLSLWPPLQEYTETPHPFAFWLPLSLPKLLKICQNSVLKKKRQTLKLARCLFRRNTDSFTWWLLFAHKKYKQPPTAIPLSAASLFFFPKQRSPPLTSSLLSSSHPSYPQTVSTTLSLLRFLLRSLCISDETCSAREEGKKNLVLRRASCAGLKEMFFSPSFPPWGVAAGKGWSLGGLPTKGKVCGHWGFRASPHLNQQETSAEIVKAGLVADQLIHFLLKRLLDSQV